MMTRHSSRSKARELFLHCAYCIEVDEVGHAKAGRFTQYLCDDIRVIIKGDIGGSLEHLRPIEDGAISPTFSKWRLHGFYPFRGFAF